MAGIGPGQRVAAVGGGALIVLMFFDWFEGASAWQLKRVDLLLLAVALMAIAIAGSRLAGRRLLRPGSEALGLVVAGAVALGTMITLVFESTGGTIALVLSLLAAGGILAGGLIAGGQAGAVDREPPRA